VEFPGQRRVLAFAGDGAPGGAVERFVAGGTFEDHRLAELAVGQDGEADPGDAPLQNGRLRLFRKQRYPVALGVAQQAPQVGGEVDRPACRRAPARRRPARLPWRARGYRLRCGPCLRVRRCGWRRRATASCPRNSAWARRAAPAQWTAWAWARPAAALQGGARAARCCAPPAAAEAAAPAAVGRLRRRRSLVGQPLQLFIRATAPWSWCRSWAGVWAPVAAWADSASVPVVLLHQGDGIAVLRRMEEHARPIEEEPPDGQPDDDRDVDGLAERARERSSSSVSSRWMSFVLLELAETAGAHLDRRLGAGRSVVALAVEGPGWSAVEPVGGGRQSHPRSLLGRCSGPASGTALEWASLILLYWTSMDGSKSARGAKRSGPRFNIRPRKRPGASRSFLFSHLLRKCLTNGCGWCAPQGGPPPYQLRMI